MLLYTTMFEVFFLGGAGKLVYDYAELIVPTLAYTNFVLFRTTIEWRACRWIDHFNQSGNRLFFTQPLYRYQT